MGLGKDFLAGLKAMLRDDSEDFPEEENLERFLEKGVKEGTISEDTFQELSKTSKAVEKEGKEVSAEQEAGIADVRVSEASFFAKGPLEVWKKRKELDGRLKRKLKAKLKAEPFTLPLSDTMQRATATNGKIPSNASNMENIPRERGGEERTRTRN